MKLAGFVCALVSLVLLVIICDAAAGLKPKDKTGNSR
jgi:hypothetical protein